MAKRFLGFQGGGAAFDLGDGGPPMIVPRSWADGLTGPVDPAMAAAIPPAPGATGETALAANEFGLDGPIGAGVSLTGKVAASKAAPPPGGTYLPPSATAVQPIPASSAPAEGTWDNPKIPDLGLHTPAYQPPLSQRAAEASSRPAQREPQFSTPPMVLGASIRDSAKSGAPDPNKEPSQLVAAPGTGNGGRAASGAADPLANLNPAEREEYFLRERRAQMEAQRRASPGVVIPGGKTQTGEQWQGEVGPNADTAARGKALREQLAPLLGKRAEAQQKLATEQAQSQAQQAEEDRKGAEAQAEIGRRRTEELGQIADQGRQLQQKIASAEVDPNRWWASRGTGEKIAVGAAVALSDIARGLIGRNRQGQNPILASVSQAIDKDVEQQIRAIDKQRADLNDIQKIYVQAKSRYEDESLAADIAKQAAQAGLRAEMAKAAADYQGLQAQEAVYSPENLKFMREAEELLRTAMDPNESPIARLAADARYKELAAKTRSRSAHAWIAQLELEIQDNERQAAIETKVNGVLSKSFGFVGPRVVGGSSGPNMDKIISDKQAQGKMLRGADEAATKAKGDKDEKNIFVNGQPVSVGKGASQPSVDRAQTRISYADDVISIVNTVEADKKAGRYIPGDPVQGMDALSLANGLAQMAGGGVASESDKADAAAALNPRDPRHSDAMNRIRQRATAAKVNAAKSVGAKF